MKGISNIQNPPNYQLTTDTGKYTIESLQSNSMLAKPEQASVYKAISEGHTSQQTKSVVIKQISKNCSIDDNLIKQEIVAMHVATQLQTPSLLPLIDSYEDKDYYFFIMPYCNKGTLESYIEAKHINNEYEAIECFRQICYGVRSLHNKKIALKGLRTEDIWVNDDNGKISMAISDYGLARSVNDSATNYKLLAMRAPEVYLGIRGIEEDIYALGCILFKMLCRKEYLNYSSENDVKTLQANFYTILVNSEWKLSEFSLVLLEGCLQYDYKSRISMDEIANALELDFLFSNYKKLNIDSKGDNNLINTKERRKKEIAAIDFVNIADYANTPIKVIEKREGYDAATDKPITESKDMEYKKPTQELESDRHLLESIKSKQELYDTEYSERSKQYAMQKMELESLKNDILNTKHLLTSNELKDIKNNMCVLQERINDNNKTLLDYIGLHKGEIEELKKMCVGEISKLQAFYSSQYDATNLKFSQQINDSKAITDYINMQKADLTEIKKSITLIKVDNHSTEHSSIETAYSQLQDTINERFNNCSKQLIEATEKLKNEFDEFKKQSNSAAIAESHTNDVANLKSQITQMSDAFALKIAENVKSTADTASNAKNDIAEVRKLLSMEINKLQSANNQAYDTINTKLENAATSNKTINEMLTIVKNETSEHKGSIKSIQDCVSQQLYKYAEEAKQITSNVELHKQEIIEIKESIVQIKEGISSKAKEYDKFKSDIVEFNASMVKIESISQTNNTLQGQFNTISNSTSEISKELSAIKSDTSAEISKLQGQITQLQANQDQRNTAFLKELKDVTDSAEKNKQEMVETRKLISESKLETFSAEISKLQAQITTLQDAHNIKINNVNSEVKQLIEFIETEKLDIQELKKAMPIINTESTAEDIDKLHSLVFQLQETVNQKLIVQTKDHKSIIEQIDKIQSEMEECKKQRNAETAKYQSQFLQFQDSTNQKIASILNEIKIEAENPEKNNKIASEISTPSVEVAPTDKTSSAEISKMQAQLHQLQDSINTKFSTISISFSKQISEFIELQKAEIQSLKKKNECKSDGVISSSELASLHAKIYELQENINQRLAFHFKENKVISESSEKLKTDVYEMRKSMYAIRSPEANANEISKMHGQLYQLQESINQRLSLYGKESKIINDTIEKLKLEIIDTKKSVAHLDIASPEIAKLQTLVYQLQEAISQKVIKRTEEERKLNDELQSQRNDISKIKSIINSNNNATATDSSISKTAEGTNILPSFNAIKKDIEEIKQAITNGKIQSDNELAKLQSQLLLIQESNKSNYMPIYEKMDALCKEIEEIKAITAHISTDATATAESIKMQQQLLALQDALTAKLNALTKEIKDIKVSVDQGKEANSDHNECAVIKLETAEINKNTTALSEEMSTANSRLKDHDAQLDSLLKSVSAIEKEMFDIQGYAKKIRVVVADIDALKHSLNTLSIHPAIQEVLNRLGTLESSNVQTSSPKKDVTFHYFKAFNKEVMKIELVDAKFKITSSSSAVQDEIGINEISLLKLDDASKCVILTKKTPISPSKSQPKSNVKLVSLQLYEDTLPEAIELYKFIRNAHLLKSEKKLMLANSP